MEGDDHRGWSMREMRRLLSVWSNASVQDQLKNNYRNRYIYEDVAGQLRERGHTKTWKQCQTKIKHLKCMYRKAKRCGDPASCPFYYKIDRVLGNGPSESPGYDEVDSEEDEDGSEHKPLIVNGVPCGRALPLPAETPVVHAEAAERDAAERDAAERDVVSALSSSSSSDDTQRERQPLGGGGHNGSRGGRANGPAACTAKKSRFEMTLETFANVLSTNSRRYSDVLLQMQAAQHAQEKELFGMMIQAITSLERHPQAAPRTDNGLQ